MIYIISYSISKKTNYEKKDEVEVIVIHSSINYLDDNTNTPKNTDIILRVDKDGINIKSPAIIDNVIEGNYLNQLNKKTIKNILETVINKLYDSWKPGKER